MSQPRIESVEARLFHVPLREVLSDAMHGNHAHFELITVLIHLSDGSYGTGYTYTGGFGGHAILAMIQQDLTPFLLNKDPAAINELYQAMQWRIHYVGRGGVSAFAISAIDIALWDIKGKQSHTPLVELAGGAADSTRAYYGGIDLNFSKEKLLGNISSYLDAGFNGVKIKVGRSELAEDVDRVQAVRKLIGKENYLMVDANYGLNEQQALQACKAFADSNLHWFEEPVDPDNFAAYRRIAKATDIPLAMGENFHIHADFERALQAIPLGYIQPDAGNCGGITGFLRVAELARTVGIPVCSHGMQELNVSLLSAQENAGWLEVHSFPIIDYTTQELTIKDHRAVAPQVEGNGVEFVWSRLEPFAVAPAP